MIMLMPMVANAQRVDKPGEPYEVYCLVTYNMESKGVVSFRDDNSYICSENEDEIKFGSYAELLSYMSKRGWSFVWEDEIKVLTSHSPRALMRKQVVSDSQAKEYLILKDVIKKKKKG